MSQQAPSIHSSTRPSLENAGRKRPVSERRIEANRRNALRSTGPTTARGKRTVARNAIKHGFLAREVVITAGDGKEDLNEFHDIVEKLCEQYEPVGVVEESLVQTIATCLWRKARVIRAENGEIRKRLDLLAVDRALRISDEGNLNVAFEGLDLRLFSAENSADDKVSSRERWSVLQAAQTGLRGHHSDLNYLCALLTSAKSDIASQGYISEKIRQKIVSAFYFWDCIFALTCGYAGPSETKEEPNPSTDIGAEEADRRASLVAFIDSRLERISQFEGLATEREDLAVDAEARRCSLPPVDATDKLLRTKLTSTGNFIALWTSLSICNDSAGAKECRRLSTSIWKEGDSHFCETKPISPLFSISANPKRGVTLDESPPLASPGLIDSMASVDLFLSSKTHVHSWGEVQAKDLDTVAKMFATAWL